MGNVVTLLVRLCEKGGDKDVEIHDVDVVCCSTMQESSSDSESTPTKTILTYNNLVLYVFATK